MIIIASGHTFVNGVFRFFRQISRGIFGQGACWGFAVRWPQAVVSGRLRAGHARPLRGGGGLGWWYRQGARVNRWVGDYRKGYDRGKYLLAHRAEKLYTDIIIMYGWNEP